METNRDSYCIMLSKNLKHLMKTNGKKRKTLSERISEYNGEVNFYEYKWDGLIDEKLFCE